MEQHVSAGYRARQGVGGHRHGCESRELTQRAKDLPHFFTALSVTGEGKFIPQTGAVLVKDAEGRIIGAIGASGGTGDEDEAVCIHGVESVGLVPG